MQTDLANEGMQGVPIEADARAVRPYRSSESPAWYYSLLTTTYYLLLTLSPPLFSSHPVKKVSQNKKNAPSVTLFYIFRGS
jgi:hypothetical protein